MKQFVFKELKNKQTIYKIFTNIDKVIHSSPNFLTLNNITGIYVDVNKEVIKFNDDLNQVSHKLTLLFTGYVHLYAVYMIWKKFSTIGFKEANKPYDELLSNKEKHFEFFLK